MNEPKCIITAIDESNGTRVGFAIVLYSISKPHHAKKLN